jgi:hypothetical protein
LGMHGSGLNRKVSLLLLFYSYFFGSIYDSNEILWNC